MINFNITIRKSHLYAFGLMLVLALGALFVNAYGSGGPPSVVGHSLEEIGLNVTCSGSQKLTSDGSTVSCATDLQGITSESDPQVGNIGGATDAICQRDSSSTNLRCDSSSRMSGGHIILGASSGLYLGNTLSSSPLALTYSGNNGYINTVSQLLLSTGSGTSLMIDGSTNSIILNDGGKASSYAMCWSSNGGGIGHCTTGVSAAGICTCSD